MSEYLGQSEINVLQEAKPFVTMVFQNFFFNIKKN